VKTIELEKSKLIFVDDHVVITETKEGVTIDAPFVKQAYDIIEENLPGNYTLILDRKNKYRLMRFEVAKEDAQRDRLKGIATVVYNSTSMQMAKIDKPVSKKPFDIFDNLDDAIAWAKAHHV
jgi:hypothetical protein